mgnify:CR=1 FL=1
MISPTTPTFPSIELRSLDELWFQVGGTLCNLTCKHCFISCSPSNHQFGFLSLESIQATLEESRALAVKGYYFTGGEPFLNPEMTDILVATLQIGPATVLTNAMRIALCSALEDGEREGPNSAVLFSIDVDTTDDNG